jgi:hypothetical protein
MEARVATSSTPSFKQGFPMTYALITPPLAEALALGEVKAHLRLDGADVADPRYP